MQDLTPRKLAGGLLALMVALAVAHGVFPSLPAWPSGLAAWVAAALLWRHAAKGQRVQVLILSSLGLLGLIWGWQLGDRPALGRVIDQNHALISMLAAVTFLRLVSAPAGEVGERSPRGWPAYLRTIAGIHLFGAVINLSAVAIIGDRLARRGSFDRRTATLISRGFSSASMWSPFFAGMAVVLTYVPGAELPSLMAVGLPLAMCGLAYTVVRQLLSDRSRLSSFSGYPIHFESLWIPGALASCVLLTHTFVPAWSILTTISLFAPTLSLVILWRRTGGAEALRATRRHALDELPAMSGELLLFLAAGVLAVGLSSVFSGYSDWFPIREFTGTSATIVLFVTVTLSALGIHPIISVTTVAVWLTPIEPDPNLLGLVFLMTWGIGVAASPLSATHLMIQGRYGVEGWRFLRWNLDYCLLLLVLGAAALNLYWAAA